MAKIEQIKAELNRRIELYGNPLGVADVRLQDERKGMLKALSDMLAFIDSLPAETASPELDLEKEIRNYDSYLDESGLTVTLDAIAHHFAEWQYQKDRREFAKLKTREWCDGFNSCCEQMEKEAVEVVVVDDWQYGKDTDGAKPAIKVRNPGWKIGDKKKVIILKEE